VKRGKVKWSQDNINEALQDVHEGIVLIDQTDQDYLRANGYANEGRVLLTIVQKLDALQQNISEDIKPIDIDDEKHRQAIDHADHAFSLLGLSLLAVALSAYVFLFAVWQIVPGGWYLAHS